VLYLLNPGPSFIAQFSFYEHFRALLGALG
jgi:hypothetical protein